MKHTTYALVTVTLRVGIEHEFGVDPNPIFESLEISKGKVEGGKVFTVDTVEVDEVDIVEE